MRINISEVVNVGRTIVAGSVELDDAVALVDQFGVPVVWNHPDPSPAGIQAIWRVWPAPLFAVLVMARKYSPGLNVTTP